MNSMVKINDPYLVTVFILTVGDPSFPYCEEAIKKQVYENFHLEIIRNVSPFNRAAQEMINRSKTKYFIQVDEDMILDPDAVGHMTGTMEQLPDDIAMLIFHLWDADRERKIQGVKIFRTEHLKKMQWTDRKHSIMSVIEQFRDHNLRWVLHNDIVGKHGVIYTPETIYWRYKSMYEKDLSFFNRVANDIYIKAIKYKKTGDILHLFALLGAVHGIISAEHQEDKEKDYTQYHTEALNLFKRLFLGDKPPAKRQAYKADKIFEVKHPPVNYEDLNPKT